MSDQKLQGHRWGRARIGLIQLGVFLALTGCASTRQIRPSEIVRYQVERVFPNVSYEDLWTTTRDVLIDFSRSEDPQRKIEIYTRDTGARSGIGRFIVYHRAGGRFFRRLRTQYEIRILDQQLAGPGTTLGVEASPQVFEITFLSYPEWVAAKGEPYTLLADEILDEIVARVRQKATAAASPG